MQRLMLTLMTEPDQAWSRVAAAPKFASTWSMPVDAMAVGLAVPTAMPATSLIVWASGFSRPE